VTHTPLQSSVPSNIGVPMVRTVAIDADGRLRLSGPGLRERVTLICPKWGRPSRGELWQTRSERTRFLASFFMEVMPDEQLPFRLRPL
jgi:hypothetical protein